MFAQPLGLATIEFLTFVQQEQIFKYDRNGQLWLQLEIYFKPSSEKQGCQHIEHILKQALEQSSTGHPKTKDTGTYLMEVSPEIIRQVYLSNDPSLLDLFEKYVPTPPASFFAEQSVPEKIKLRAQQAQETLKKVSLKTLEPLILKAQRHLRNKRRQREELRRIEHVYEKQLSSYHITAAALMQDANTPYTPKCGANLAKRIRDAAQKVSAFSSVKHITSKRTIQSVLDEGLYGRRTLLDWYMTFKPAALMSCDIVNGDGNAVCLGPQDIDPGATGSIIIEFDLPKLLQTKPSAFYKQKDLEYLVRNKIRQVLLGDTALYFDHTGYVRCQESELAYLKILKSSVGNHLQHIAACLKPTLIAYDLEQMHAILTLNFFRFMDGMWDVTTDKTSQAYIEEFYQKVAELDDHALISFLTDIEKNLTDTAEFNFYGAHQINFSTVTSISDRHSGYTLKLAEFLHALNSGELDLLRQAREFLPKVFQSYRFLDYLLTHTQHPDARYYLDDLRKLCKTPNWIPYTPIEPPSDCRISKVGNY